jgi:hypothetical protein
VFRTTSFFILSFQFSLCACVCTEYVYYVLFKRIFKGNYHFTCFWKYESPSEHNPYVRCNSTVVRFFAVEVETEYSCINTTCRRGVCIFTLLFMSEQKFQISCLTTTNRFSGGCLVVADIDFMNFSNYCFLTFTYSSLLRTGAS